MSSATVRPEANRPARNGGNLPRPGRFRPRPEPRKPMIISMIRASDTPEPDDRTLSPNPQREPAAGSGR